MPQSGRFLFSVKNHLQNESLEYSLAVFVQKFMKLSVLYDVLSHKTYSKAEVYFGRDHSLSTTSGKLPHHQKNSNHSTHSSHSSSSAHHLQHHHHNAAYYNHSSSSQHIHRSFM